MFAATVAVVSLRCVPNAQAAIVTTVPLATAASYSVLGGSTVTNTNSTVLHRSLGLWPGTDVTGFPPGTVVAPGTMDVTNDVAKQAQTDLTTAYVNAAGRPIDATTAADLTDLVLPGGVYAGPSKGALLLSGPLVLDGGGDPTSVFIFQTNSSLTTASASTVTLTNGAQECNVFWQVGSSATLGTDSVFAGSILALTSITVDHGAVVHGRALARNAAVTMDDDVFTTPTCATTPTTTTTAAGATTTTTEPGSTTTPTTPGATATTVPPPGGATGGAAGGTTGGATGAGADGPGRTGAGASTSSRTGRSTTAVGRAPSLPATGSSVPDEVAMALALLALGVLAVGQQILVAERADR